MCGIAGIISTEKIENIDERISRMLDVLVHRGPDADGKLIIGGCCALGHKRLSIIDLDSRSNQPMTNYAENTIVYNGEIYNYEHIKNELLYPFQTESDTEVILAGIDTRGIEWTLNQCNGMFAFAYHNANSGITYLARDRMGIKPVYYYQDDGLFVFASEIKSILNSGLVKAEINSSAIDEYLGNRYIRAPFTFFKNIYQVLPGHYLTIDNNCIVIDKEYWCLPTLFNIEKNYKEEDILEEFEERICSVIKMRMMSDVPLGTYLSGGVDSSLISAIAAKNKREPLETFTIGFPELNEFTYAAEVAKKYETNHHEILMTNTDYFSMMREVIAYKDAPLGVPNEIPLAQMSKELKKYITVVLSGEGADELMGGYGRIFRSAYDYSNHRGIASTFYDYFVSLYEYVPRYFRDKYIKTDRSIRDEFDAYIRNEFNSISGDEAVFRFFHRYHVKGLLQRCDTTTMLASVEARVPFLDHTLIEYAYKNIPYDLKLKWKSEKAKSCARNQFARNYSEELDIPKYLLKRVAYKYLPAGVVNRKKMGFPVPLDTWISKLSEQATEILKGVEWLRTDRIEEMVLECKKINRGGQILWMLINVELFRGMYFNREWRY